MKKFKYLTLDRQFASGGREIGEKVAEKLGIPFHNQDILEMSAQNLGVSLDKAKRAEETIASSVIYSLSLSSNPSLYDNGVIPMADKVFFEESKIIRKYVGVEDSCVIVGRCSDVILGNRPDCLRVFICSDMQARINRAVETYGFKPVDAEKVLRKNDRRRTSFYEFNTDQKWGYRENYHLILNSSSLGIEACVEILANLMQQD
jgi:hypothetical protein